MKSMLLGEHNDNNLTYPFTAMPQTLESKALNYSLGLIMEISLEEGWRLGIANHPHQCLEFLMLPFQTGPTTICLIQYTPLPLQYYWVDDAMACRAKCNAGNEFRHHARLVCEQRAESSAHYNTNVGASICL